MPKPGIGEWIRRERLGEWHLVDSTVEDRVLARCGRWFAPTTPSGGGLEVSPIMPLTRMIGQPQLCWQCDRGKP